MAHGFRGSAEVSRNLCSAFWKANAATLDMGGAFRRSKEAPPGILQVIRRCSNGPPDIPCAFLGLPEAPLDCSDH